MTGNNNSAKNLVDVRELNLSLIIKLIHKMKVCSRAQLAEISELKQSTITNIINELIDCEIVKETGSFIGKKGRRSIGVTLNNEKYRVIGVRLTRNTYSVGLFDVNGCAEKTVFRRSAPDDPVEEILDDIKSEIQGLMYNSPHKVVAVGIAVPGPYLQSDSQILLISGAHKWESINFSEQFSSRINIPFYIEHDANAGAMAEWWYGKKKLEQGTYLYIAAGPGIGAGIIIDGQVFHGAMGIAGEIGHMTINYNGLVCSCGNIGCLEMYASSSAVCRSINETIAGGTESSLPIGCSYDQVMEAYIANDVVALEAFKKSAEFLGIGIANMIYTYNPNTIIIGDDMAKGGEPYLAWVCETVRKLVLPKIYLNTKIDLCSFQEDPAFIGAAALAIDKSFQNPSRLLVMLNELN